MKRLEEIFLRFSVNFFISICCLSLVFLSHHFATGVMVTVVFDKLIFALMAASAIFTVAHFTYYGFDK